MILFLALAYGESPALYSLAKTVENFDSIIPGNTCCECESAVPLNLGDARWIVDNEWKMTVWTVQRNKCTRGRTHHQSHFARSAMLMVQQKGYLVSLDIDCLSVWQWNSEKQWESGVVILDRMKTWYNWKCDWVEIVKVVTGENMGTFDEVRLEHNTHNEMGCIGTFTFQLSSLCVV